MKKQIYSLVLKFSDRYFVDVTTDKAQYEKFKDSLLNKAKWNDDIFFIFNYENGNEKIISLDDVRIVEVKVLDIRDDEDEEV